MRVNIYAEEITNIVTLITKKGDDGRDHVGIRFYMQLPVTTQDQEQIQGPFMHHPGDDDSAAVTFWGKRAMIPALERALELLRDFYADPASGPYAFPPAVE